MGFIDKILKRPEKKAAFSTFQTFTEYAPAFQSWRGSIYESEMIRACVHAFASACSKLEPHYEGTMPNVERLFRAWPNDRMTWSQFLYRLATVYEVDCTAYVIRLHDQNGATTGLWPLKCDSADVIDYSGQMWFRFHLPVGKPLVVPATDVCVLSKYQYVSDLFGTANTLSGTLDLLNAQMQAEKSAIKIGSRIMYIGKLVGTMADEDIDDARQRFAAQNLSEDNDTGLMAYDGRFTDVTPVSHNAYTIDSVEMQRIDDHVFNYFGINKNVLQNSCSEEDWDSYYEGKVETWAIQLSDGLNKLLFTKRSILTNRISFTANRMQFMSAASKRNMVRDMTDRRLMTVNEGREILGLSPVPGGDVFINRGEYMVLDMQGNVVYQTGGELASALPPSDVEDAVEADLGGDDAIYNDVDGKYESDVDE